MIGYAPLMCFDSVLNEGKGNSYAEYKVVHCLTKKYSYIIKSVLCAEYKHTKLRREIFLIIKHRHSNIYYLHKIANTYFKPSDKI